MNFRNAVTHCIFPFSDLTVTETYKLTCSKEHLLTFDNWKQSKKDILLMPNNIDLVKLIKPMNNDIKYLFDHTLFLFSDDIINAYEKLENLKTKYKVKNPIIVNGSTIIPIRYDLVYKTMIIVNEIKMEILKHNKSE